MKPLRLADLARRAGVVTAPPRRRVWTVPEILAGSWEVGPVGTVRRHIPGRGWIVRTSDAYLDREAAA